MSDMEGLIREKNAGELEIDRVRSSICFAKQRVDEYQSKYTGRSPSKRLASILATEVQKFEWLANGLLNDIEKLEKNQGNLIRGKSYQISTRPDEELRYVGPHDGTEKFEEFEDVIDGVKWLCRVSEVEVQPWN